MSWPDHALQRTRQGVVVSNRRVPWAWSLSLGRSADYILRGGIGMFNSWSTPREIVVQGAPCTMLSWQVGRCDLAVYIMRDQPGVMIGRGDMPPREADLLEVEALAERFNSNELRLAADRMKNLTPRAAVAVEDHPRIIFAKTRTERPWWKWW
jgi:hypothetical protein